MSETALSDEVVSLRPRSLAALSKAERWRLIGRSLDRLYRWYEHRSQIKRNWNANFSFAWAELGGLDDPKLLNIIEGLYAVEQFAPDYAAETMSRNRDVYARSQFYMRWGSEEAKHADVLRNVLVFSGHRSEDWLHDYTIQLRREIWRAPFTDSIEQVMYAVLQERATQITYLNLARSLTRGQTCYEGTRNEVVRSVATKLAIDEAAHFNFFLEMARLYLYYLPEQSLAALSRVLSSFVMPAAAIIPDYDKFVHDLYERALFGRRIYGRDVAKVCLKVLGCRPEMTDGKPLTARASDSSETFSVDMVALESAIGRLFDRLESYFELHSLPLHVA